MNNNSSGDGSSINNVTDDYVSTLLIPEGLAWLPYASLVCTVLFWLGYDFFKFHQKNRQKYDRKEEQMVIIRTVPSRQRISMVSGIGLRFRRGKPVLGHVWNTSPSSSDMSSCFSPVHQGRVAYSREVTPSDEGGDYSETETIARCNSDLVSQEEEEEEDVEEGTGENKGWELGGEPIGDKLCNKQNDSRTANRSQRGYGYTINEEKELENESKNQRRNGNSLFPESGISSRPTDSTIPSITTTPPTDAPSSITLSLHPAHAAPTKGAGGGVDDGGGGRGDGYIEAQGGEPRFKDVSTQTSFEMLVPLNVRSGHLSSARNELSHLVTTPLKHSPRQHRYSIAGDLGFRHPAMPALDETGHMSLPRTFSRSSHSPFPTFDWTGSDSSSPSKLSARSDKRHPPLRLDLLAGSYSPTSEIVATKHGFVLEGKEVPNFPGCGSRPLHSSGSDVFKQPETPSKPAPPAKTLTSTPAVTARVPSPHPLSPKHPVSHHNDSHRSYLHNINSQQAYDYEQQPHRHGHHRHHHHHHQHQQQPHQLHRSKRPHALGFDPSKSASGTSRSVRAASSSPRMLKEGGKTAESPTFKYANESQESPQSAPIPTHLYHQDEEGFFSSIHSSSSRHGGFSGQGDASKRGILFFSRLSGIGRSQEYGAGGSYRRKSGSTYTTGGFES